MLSPTYKTKVLKHLCRVRIGGLVMRGQGAPYCYRCYLFHYRCQTAPRLEWARFSWKQRKANYPYQGLWSERGEPYFTIDGVDYDVCRRCHKIFDHLTWQKGFRLNPGLVDDLVWLRYGVGVPS